jgi:hypothetical protein
VCVCVCVRVTASDTNWASELSARAKIEASALRCTGLQHAPVSKLKHSRLIQVGRSRVRDPIR